MTHLAMSNRVASARLAWSRRLVAAAFLVAVPVLALRQLDPPEPAPVDAPASDFSASRARGHLEHIARAPHPVGSLEHAAVRDYVVAALEGLGLSAERQRATVAQDETRAQLTLCNVENIVARLRGTGDGTEAVLLMAHYDSVPTGPGVSDDGHAVAVLLETLRALRSGPPLERDVVFLFTDAEEVGLLGAQAFVESSPHRQGIALALNFEARGTGGPAFLFETSPGGGGLPRALAEAAPFPMSSSLIDEVYRRLPNDTDLSVLRAAGIAGMNFAYFDGYLDYHSQRDSLETLDLASVQHQGSYALSLVRYFGDTDRRVEPGSTASAATWFNLTRGWLVVYPQVWTSIGLGLVVVGAIALLIRGRRRGQLRLGGVAAGLVCLAGALIAAPLLAHALWSLLGDGTAGDPTSLMGEPHNAALYRLGFVLLALATTTAIVRIGRRFGHTAELALGALIGELILALVLTMTFPGGAYLVVWPSLFSLIACAAIAGARADAAWPAWPAVMVALAAAVAIWLLAPWIELLLVLLTLQHLAVAIAVAVVLAGFLIPLLATDRGWRLPGLVGVAGAGALIAGVVTAAPTREHPAMGSLQYALDADTREARWIADELPDDGWTTQLLPPGGARTPLAGFFPFTDWTFYQAPAPTAALPAPTLAVLDDRVAGGVRRLRVRVRSGGPAESVLVYLLDATPVRAVEVHGRRYDRQQTSDTARWALRYIAPPPDGIELTVETEAAAPISLRVVDQYFGVTRVAAPPRPADVIETPYGFGSPDRTYVGRTFAAIHAGAAFTP